MVKLNLEIWDKIMDATEMEVEDGNTLVDVGGDHNINDMTTGGYGSMELNEDILRDVTGIS